MAHMNIRSIVFFLLIAVAIPSFSQDEVKETAIPQVFLIGEYEGEYEQLGVSCNQILLSVCGESMEMAYDLWLSMLSDLEVYATSMNYDIKGVKIWMNVYWNEDGTIRHLAYYPKPNSRNMDFDQLTNFLKGFVTQYQMPIQYSQCFSHYGSASFPTFAKLFKKKENK